MIPYHLEGESTILSMACTYISFVIRNKVFLVEE